MLRTIFNNRAVYLKKLVCLFFGIGILYSYNLWINIRPFPVFPVFDKILITSHYNFLLRLSLLCLFTILVIIENRKIFFLLFFLLIFVLLQDQMRWQPWVYLYTLLLVPFLFTNNKATILNYFKICFIGVYIWSGIHKLNPNFLDFILENFLVDFFKIESVAIISNIKSIGYIFPVLEILIGIFLLNKKTRMIGIFMAIFLHLFILVIIKNNNNIIIPWNIFMIIGVLLLFYNTSEKIFLWKTKNLKSNLLHTFLVIVFLLPIGNFFNKWNTSLSFSLYSGKPKFLYILINDSHLNQLDREKFQYAFIDNNIINGKIIDVNRWSYYWLNVPFYGENQFTTKVIKEFCIDIKSAKYIETELPLWNRITFEEYKTSQEKNVTIKTDSLLFIKFKKPIRQPNYKVYNCN